MEFSNKQLDTPDSGFQFLENLSTAYWYSEILFAALELNLFGLIEQGHQSPESLAAASNCNKEHLHRMMKVLYGLGLIQPKANGWINRPATRQYLLSESPEFIGNFLLYRKYIQKTWQKIPETLSSTTEKEPVTIEPSDNYDIRNYHYVRAMDEIAKQKAKEIERLCRDIIWPTPILDIGGGAGALSRKLVRTNRKGTAILFDLPEVIRDAKSLYPHPEDWSGIQTMEGNFITHQFDEAQRFGTIIVSNFLHVYNRESAKILIRKAVALLAENGCLLIHDYFPDRTNHHSHKGLLYDINMMLNTYDGACHSTSWVISCLKEMHTRHIAVRDLPSDSSIILASINCKVA